MLLGLFVFVFGYWVVQREARMLTSENQGNTISFVVRLGYIVNSKIFHAVLFIWGLICCSIMAYYSALSHFTNVWEYRIGAAYGFLLGAPSWIGLPLVVILGRKRLLRSSKTLFFTPVVFMVIILFT
jgi:hypothetical protein